MGVDVELVEGVGPGRRASRCARSPLSSGSASPIPTRRSRRSSRRSRIVRARARARAGGRRLLRRAVHRRRLPRRRQAVARVRHREDADVPRAGRLARAARQARRLLRRATSAAQVRAGADVVQLFDSWVGALSPADYEEFVAPWSARILAAVDVPDDPLRHRRLDAAARDGARRRRRDRPRLAHPARRGLGARRPDRAVQGNLDPAVLLGPWERVEAAARDVLARAGGRPGHIFNLGHGVLPRHGSRTDFAARTAGPGATVNRCDGRTDRRRPGLADVPRLPEGAADAQGRVRRARPARRARRRRRSATSR